VSGSGKIEKIHHGDTEFTEVARTAGRDGP
jgi:hypothetical protein